MSAIKILQVLGRLDRGGAETMLMNLYRHIDKENVQFDFVIHTTEECDYSAEVRSLGGKIYSLKPFTAATASGYRRQWRDFFDEHKSEYKAVHAHMRSTASIFLDEAKKLGLKTIAHSHNTSSGKGISAIVKNYLQKGIIHKADYLFSCSDEAGIWLYGAKAWKERKHFILKNGIDPENFIFNHEIRGNKRSEFKANYDIILHVGRFDEQKNHRFLITLMRELIKRKPDTLLLLCGAGPLRPEIESLVNLYAISDNVKFLGVRNDINELMMAADIMLFPSLFEGLPVTLIEAQCTGLPVLMSDRVDGSVKITELISELSLAKGPESWAGCAIDLLENAKSSVSGRKSPVSDIKIAGYDADENAKWLEKFYIQL